MKKIILSLLFTLMLIPVSFHAASEAYMILSFPGEYANSEVNISWHMDETETTGKLQYTKYIDTTWENPITVNASYEKKTLFPDKTFNHYKVNLTGLEPNTKYRYRVGSSTYSSDQFFKTGNTNFTFAWVSDWHTYGPIPRRLEAHSAMVQTLLKKDRNISMILSTGDETSYGDVYSDSLQTNSQVHWKEHLKASAPGNHDYLNHKTSVPNNLDFFRALSNFPENGYENQEGISYFFKYGNTLFIFLNSYDASVMGNIKARTWASEVIKKHPSDFVVVAMHYNWFDGTSGNSYQYNVWRNFFDQNNVDLALSGHNHIYVRTHRIYQGEVNPQKGTVFMQANSMDNDRGREMGNLNYNQNVIAKRYTEGAKTVTGSIISISANEIKTRLIDRNGNVIDEAVITKREQPSITTEEQNRYAESLVYYKTASGNYVYQSSWGVNKVRYIEYTIGGETYINYLESHDQVIYKLPDGISSDIDVRVMFRNGHQVSYTLSALSENYLNVSNVNVLNQNGYTLTWDYTGPSEKAYVFVDDVFLKEVDLEERQTDLGDISIDSIVTLQQSKDRSQSRYYARYNTYGDANFDGTINNEDIELLIKYHFTPSLITTTLFPYMNANKDDEINLYDITAFHLIANGLLNPLKQKEVTITFLDIYGNILDTQTVLEGSPVIPPTYHKVGFNFLMWDKDLSQVNTDMIVYPIMGVN